MRVNQLMDHWKKHASGPLTEAAYRVRLPMEDAARLAALQEMFPQKTVEALITDLLHAALDEFESSLPYVQGSRVVAEDELGDPLYEDAGETPRFLSLSHKHLRRLKGETVESE